MRVTYAVQTSEDLEVGGWFLKVGERLRKKKGIVLSGDVKSLGGGMYVVTVENLWDTWALLIGPGMLMLSGVVAWVFWQSAGWSNGLVYSGLASMVMVYALASPGGHRLLMRFTLRRLTGRWVMVKPATSEALWRLTHGKV